MDPLEQHLPYALRQFENEILVPLEIFGINASFTTSSSAKLTTAILLVIYLVYAAREGRLVPNRLQASAELVYSFVADTVTRVAGPEAKPSIPFIFTTFVFVLLGTLLGLTPIKETFTTHLVVTLALALMIFVYVTVLAFRKQGLGFFRTFLPAGVPLFVAPVLILVEVISYLFRPITLGFRIFANLVAGHVMLKLFGDFCAMMVVAWGLGGALAAVVPVSAMVVLYGFEVAIVFIQSYIFMLISATYLRDALHPSH